MRNNIIRIIIFTNNFNKINQIENVILVLSNNESSSWSDRLE